MKSTRELLDAVRDRLALPSDYALQNVLGVSKQQISRYRTGADYLSEATAIKVADILSLDRGLVLAWVAGERARMPSARDAWERLAKQLGGATVAVLVALLVTEPLFLESALIYAGDSAQALPLCIMSSPHFGIFLILFSVLAFIPHEKQ